EFANRFPAVSQTLEVVNHRLCPGGLPCRRRGELEDRAAADFSVNGIGTYTAAAAEGRTVEIPGSVWDQASLWACSIWDGLEIVDDDFAPAGVSRRWRHEFEHRAAADDIADAVAALALAALDRCAIEGAGTVEKKFAAWQRAIGAAGEPMKRLLGPVRVSRFR